MSVLNEIRWLPMPFKDYVQEETSKEQIYVHHTASSPSAVGVWDYWHQTEERVATSFIIDGMTGQIVQCFSSKHWAWHLGLKAHHLVAGGKTSTWLNSHSVGIEICNWGGLIERDGKFWAYPNNFKSVTVPKEQVVTYESPYRGFKHYQRYTNVQLESTRKLLSYLCETWGIPKAYMGFSIFNIDRRALMGVPGVYTHTSVRPDKSDCHPQTEFKQMLSSL